MQATSGTLAPRSPRDQLLHEIAEWRAVEPWGHDTRSAGAWEASFILRDALSFACLFEWRADRDGAFVCLGKGEEYDPEYALWCSPAEAVALAELLAKSEGLVGEFELRAMVDAASVAARGGQ